MLKNQTQSIEVGVGGGHNLYMLNGESYFNYRQKRFIVRRNGSLPERIKIRLANELYMAAGTDGIGLLAYRAIRAGLNGHADLIPDSRKSLCGFDGVNISYHLMAVPGRRQDVAIAGDAMVEKPISKNTLILAPTDKIVSVLQNCGYKASLGGWPIHKSLKDEGHCKRTRSKLEKRERLRILVALSGQAPSDHRRLIENGVREISSLLKDESCEFVFYVAISGWLKMSLERSFQVCGVAPKIVCGGDYDEANEKFILEAGDCDVMFTMSNERMALAQIVPLVLLPPVNNNAAANHEYARANKVAIPADVVGEYGIAGAVKMIQKDPSEVIANMERAQKTMDINFGKRLCEVVFTNLQNLGKI